MFGTDAHALHVELEQRGRTSNDNVPAPPPPFCPAPRPLLGAVGERMYTAFAAGLGQAHHDGAQGKMVHQGVSRCSLWR